MEKLCDDLLYTLFDHFGNLYDLIQMKQTCSRFNTLLKNEKLMMAKLKKVHLLQDIYDKKPCWRSHRMMFPQMTHKGQLFTFQLGCNIKPVRITNYSFVSKEISVDLMEHSKMFLMLCNNINKANDYTLYVDRYPKILSTRESRTFFKNKSADLDTSLYFHCQRSQRVSASMILSIHVDEVCIPKKCDVCTQKNYIYFRVHECLIFEETTIFD